MQVVGKWACYTHYIIIHFLIINQPNKHTMKQLQKTFTIAILCFILFGSSFPLSALAQTINKQSAYITEINKVNELVLKGDYAKAKDLFKEIKQNTSITIRVSQIQLFYMVIV